MTLLEGFATHLGPLRAEASLRAANEIGVGSGTLKQRDDILRDWREAAGIRGRRLSSVGEVAAMAASIGFQVVRDIPKKAN